MSKSRRFLLDSNVCIDVLRGNARVIERMKRHKPHELVVSAITAFELYQGAERAGTPARQKQERGKVALLLSRLEVLPFESEQAKTAALINARLLDKGTPVSIADVLIASAAAALDLPLVTNNKRDFEPIADLKIIDWR